MKLRTKLSWLLFMAHSVYHLKSWHCCEKSHWAIQSNVDCWWWAQSFRHN